MTWSSRSSLILNNSIALCTLSIDADLEILPCPLVKLWGATGEDIWEGCISSVGVVVWGA